MQFSPSYHLVGASPLPLDVGYLSGGDPTFACRWLFNSCDLGVLTGDDEHRPFHSAIFVLGSMLLTDYKSEVPMTSCLG